MVKKIIVTFLIIGFIFISTTAYFVAKRIIMKPSGEFPQEQVEIKIAGGSTVTQIAKQLYEAGVVTDMDDFLFTVKVMRKGALLKAGKYTFDYGLSNYDIVNQLVHGKVVGIRVSIPEGYTSRQIASLLKDKLEVDSTKFMGLVHDTDFIHKINIDAPSLEGYLYPNTYEFYWGTDAETVIRRLLTEFSHNFNDSLRQRAADKGWSIQKVLTLASIIEGEAMIDSERAIISAVYHNRLKKRMLLQADPTIQFIIPDGPRRLLNRDLAIVSPYNTYKYRGLPPGPVNNPGINSIKAAIDPADVPYLYFVAVGDGSHTFSRTLKEHNRAKAKFDQYRREVRRKQHAKK
ncbi:endolytic transglycosylase MltG [candidate division KSB1 bacterium]|nr:endolytic transglycosylase MltG [candidate division KSB1 bacterium]